MGLFGKSKEGGFMDVIRCDEPEYLVWKWRPSGEALSTKKENAIRYGSSLRVKDGELAVFVYNNKKEGVVLRTTYCVLLLLVLTFKLGLFRSFIPDV